MKRILPILSFAALLVFTGCATAQSAPELGLTSEATLGRDTIAIRPDPENWAQTYSNLPGLTHDNRSAHSAIQDLSDIGPTESAPANPPLISSADDWNDGIGDLVEVAQ